MTSFSVVGGEPGVQGGGAGDVAGVGLAVGPFDGQGAVEAFDFAVLPGAVRADGEVLGAGAGQGVGEVVELT